MAIIRLHRRRPGGPKKKRLRKIAILPSLMTLGNGVCGFASIIVASRIHPSALYEDNPGYDDAMIFLLIAGVLIFAGMVFDALDGHMARLAKSASRFGAELDSLCDVITFGAAPAFLLLKMGPTPESRFLYNVLFISATSYVICTILRLARFNVETTSLGEESHRYFKGLPSPAAAGCIAVLAITRHELQIYQTLLNLDLLTSIVQQVIPFAALLLALLMVSNIVYPHLLNQTLRGTQSFTRLVEVVAVMIALLVIRELALVLAFWGFALSGPVRRVWRSFHRHSSEFDPDQPVEFRRSDAS